MNCILCIPTRNTSIWLNYIFNNIYIIKQAFDNLVVCFYYDISDDDTLNKLLNFKKDFGENNCYIIENNEELLQYRTHRIANARNKLIEFIENNFINYDYFIMMDSDEICSYKINIDILKEHLLLSNWDALSFNRYGLPEGHENYDIWALQYDKFIHHCHSYNGALDIVYIMINDITTKLNSLKNNELFECYSAFNGFSIYRTNKFLNIRYDGITQKYFSDEEINNMLNIFKKDYNLNLTINFDYVDNSHGGGKQNCEHIGFHINAIRQNNARIRISGKRIFD
jgi:hypothetical protein